MGSVEFLEPEKKPPKIDQKDTYDLEMSLTGQYFLQGRPRPNVVSFLRTSVESWDDKSPWYRPGVRTHLGSPL